MGPLEGAMMGKLSDHQSQKIVKVLFLGGSGSGKTGSLVSLIKAGYKLRILDMDNNLSSLVAYARRDCPAEIAATEFETRRDKYRSTKGGPIVDGQPKAFVDALDLMTRWSDGTSPGDWGADHVLVIDSLTLMGRAAFEWAKGMNPGSKDPRKWFYAAQQAIENMIAMLTSDGFQCNVIVTAHVRLQEVEDGSMKGFANAIGTALGPIIPGYFPTVLLMETTAARPPKRTIHTVPTALIDLKNPAPFRVKASYPIEGGLADLFNDLKGE